MMYRLTADLRGRIVATDTTDHAILPIAAFGPQGLVLYLLNDSPHPREVSVDCKLATAPNGNLPCEALSLDEKAGRTAIEPVGTRLEKRDGGQGLRIQFDRPMRPREIRKIILQSTAYPVTHPTNQHFADLTLAEILPGSNPEAKIVWRPRSSRDGITAAKLRVVTRDVQDGEAVIELAGGAVVLPLPSSRTGSDSSVIQEIPLTAEQIAAIQKAASGDALSIRVRCDAGYDGFALLMASLNLTTKP
jgi:hypothetical protein